ncbi:MAG: TetR/AcrR family transcriptional regulator [Clostridia bacterium]|nr:TetR/AcrR family transcriptional regulator [Clostridia bacterium]
MARKQTTTTKFEIIQVAGELFLEVGYSNTSPKMIAKELGLSTGNITYYFPTKEHLLKEIVEMLCDFQWKLLEYEADRGYGSAASICLELMTVASACAENEIARDFFVSAFQSEMCRNFLRENHVARAKRIFADRCGDWDHERYEQAEILVMGLQYATVVTTDATVSLPARISGALHQILSIYNVEEETRIQEIQKVLAMDCRALGGRVMAEFRKFVNCASEKALERMVFRRKNGREELQ